MDVNERANRTPDDASRRPQQRDDRPQRVVTTVPGVARLMTTCVRTGEHPEGMHTLSDERGVVSEPMC